LSIREWKAPKLKGVICTVHGLGEHSGRYAYVAKQFAGQGYAVMALDLRGHGKSDGKRGHAPSLNVLLDDISLLLEQASKHYKDIPRFLYGHSMGGGLVISYALRRHPPVAGIICTSPWLRLATEPSRFARFVACIANIVMPSLTQNNRLDAKGLSHDSEVVKAYMKDPLVHHHISVRLFSIIHNSGIWSIEHADSLTIPMLLMHGSKDPITSFEASRDFAVKAGEMCELVLWDGLFHEIHNEYQKDEIIMHALNWIKHKTP
jgi:alpha-beta hydrolase superfamily lysophospholipase